MLPETITVRMYGVLIALGLYLAAQVTIWIGEKEGIKKDLIWDGFIWVVLAGVIGARLYHVIDYWQFYQQNPAKILAVWEGGLGIFGALVGGILALVIYAKAKGFSKNKLLKLIDIVAIATPLGQAIGRWGNYFNQELYGRPTILPWGIEIPPANRITGYESFETFHPLFLYESLLNLFLFGLMISLYRTRYFRPGKLNFVFIYFIGYGLIRAILEPLRLETWTVSGVSVAQVIGALMVIIGSAGLMFGARIGRR